VIGDACTESARGSESLQERYLASLVGDASGPQTAELEEAFFERAEELVTECMRAAGFEYTPEEYDASADAVASDFTSRTYAETYGFGVVANATFEFPGAEPSPNDRRLADMVPALRDAYSTLRSDCRTSATAEASDQLGFSALSEAAVIAEAAALTDGRVVGANRSWSECASEQGFSFSDRASMIESFTERMQSLVGDGPQADATRFEELQNEEIAAATATFDCSTAYQRVYSDVFHEHYEWP
jgi:hypothetical protein